MIHVGLNLLFVVPGTTGGIEVYARELVGAMAPRAGSARLTAFVNPFAAERISELLPPGVEVEIVDVDPRTRSGWVRGEQTVLPGRVRARGCDLLHSFASTAPVWGGFRRVTTVHDLIYRRLPRLHRSPRFLGPRFLVSRLLIPLAVRRSDAVVAISETAARDLRETLGVPAGKVRVVPLGPGSTRRVEPAPEAKVRRRHGLGDRPFVLCACANWPHKNLENLVRGLARSDSERRPLLVVTGYPTPFDDGLRGLARSLGLGERLRLTGWVEQAELEALYRSASCCVVPSWYEGFGLPAVEAMRRGVPLACSRGGALEEVVGPGGAFFDPGDPAGIASVLNSILDDPTFARSLAERGRKRASRYSWDEAARSTLALYRELCEVPRRGRS